MTTPLHRLPAIGADASVHVVVETPAGASSKFKYDDTLGVITLSRPLPAGLTYPHDWGFVPSTCAADGDPFDALIVWEGSSYPGVVLPCRVIGALEVEQANEATRARERNDRLIVVPLESRLMRQVASILDLPQERAELEQFFLASVAFEHKELKLLGWVGPEPATALLRRSIDSHGRVDGSRP